MTTQECNGVGAPPHNPTGWQEIDWARCNREVKRLQARIVKATQESHWNKVKALQWLLTHSFSGKAFAIKRVTENKGKNTPGIDMVTWTTPEAKSQAILSLSQNNYKPKPRRRVYIPKRNGRMRPLGIPTMNDRAMEALHLLALYPVAETKADSNSYGFRPERSTADAIDQCFNVLARTESAQWIFEGDIKGCFDNINHDCLLTNVPMDKAILRKWLKAGFIDKKKLFPTEAGTPQGGVISPTLANVTLDGLEQTLQDRFGYGRKVNLVRYADDFIITGASKEQLEDEVKPLVDQFLAIRGLTLSKEKTKVTHIEEGFDFLGFNLRKYKGKLLITPAKENVNSFLQEIRRIVKDNLMAKQVNLIGMLNPKIKGWANYYQHVVASKTFNKMDHEIWKLLWQWAKRRHPNKSSHWIKKKYFKSVNGRSWEFADKADERRLNETPELAVLHRLSDTKIRRHIKIRLGANPFNPQWELYFEERMVRKMKDTLKGRKRLLKMWTDQEGKCPVCKLHITEETEWHNHHLLPRYKGGKDIISNLVLLHPDCHWKVHSLKLEVVKPALAKGLRKA